MDKFKDCMFSIFDEQWGEYKCKHLKRRIYNLNECMNCEQYKKQKRKDD